MAQEVGEELERDYHLLKFLQATKETIEEGTKLIQHKTRDGEVPSQKELSSYFEEFFSSKVPCQKELSSPNEELFPNPA